MRVDYVLERCVRSCGLFNILLCHCYAGAHRITFHLVVNLITSANYIQSWEFAHRFFERFAHFLGVKERKSDSLVKRAKRSRRSFVMSDLSESLN